MASEVDPKRRKEQLEEVYTYLRRKGVVHTKQDLAKLLASNPANISQAFSGNKAYLTDNFFIYKIGDAAPEINLDWLKTGTGPMLKTDVDNSQHMTAHGGVNVQAQGNSHIVMPGTANDLLKLERENARLMAENESLKHEIIWLRQMVETLTKSN